MSHSYKFGGNQFCFNISFLYRNEYDHPSVVTKSRRKKDTLRKKTKDFDNWENYLHDTYIKNSWMMA